MLSAFSALRRATRALLLPSLLAACYVASASAQRDPAEYRTQSVSVFGAFLHENTAFVPESGTGFITGLDFTHYFLRIPVAASLEGRADFAASTSVDERSYTFGPRVEYRFGRFRPYGEVQAGLGNIHFNAVLRNQLGYYGDRSLVVAGGGGVGIGLLRNLAAEIDFQEQHWDISPRYHTVFTPTLVSVGLRYTLPARPFVRAGDPHYR